MVIKASFAALGTDTVQVCDKFPSQVGPNMQGPAIEQEVANRGLRVLFSGDLGEPDCLTLSASTTLNMFGALLSTP